ncbi:BnaC02g00570D [Brassica napus]|uniref:(rape) hypothetical protein n=1 Tax=Brassica napus TaxID=3708 RepID=A0A078HTK9_BRANA|nr:unnamed protein product [Brassica napus]CDY40073.1 BnaC02g00570D [Brassica napus]
MKKGAKRRGASKAGREDAVAERQNGEVVAESLEESQQPKEEAEAKEEENQENGEEDKEVDEVKDEEVEGEDKKKKKPVRGGGKRKRATKKGIEVKAREALEEEGGLLYRKKVFLFGCTERCRILCMGSLLQIFILIQSIEFSFISSRSTSIAFLVSFLPHCQYQLEYADQEPVIVPVIATTNLTSLFFFFGFVDFYQPFTEDELEQNTEVQIMFPSEPPVVCEFDWELDELEEFVDKLIEDEALASEQKDEFKEYVKEQVRAAKKANREAREARRKAIEDMSEEAKQAFQSMKFYKFYPLPSPETPDVSGVKSRFINRYYGKAHEVL